MKFDYDPKPEAGRKPRAYIDTDGDLVLLDLHDYDSCTVRKNGVLLQEAGSEDRALELEERGGRVFYAGDSVTITF